MFLQRTHRVHVANNDPESFGAKIALAAPTFWPEDDQLDAWRSASLIPPIPVMRCKQPLIRP